MIQNVGENRTESKMAQGVSVTNQSRFQALKGGEIDASVSLFNDHGSLQYVLIDPRDHDSVSKDMELMIQMMHSTDENG